MIAVAAAALILWRVEVGVLILLAVLALRAGYLARTTPAGSHARRWANSYLVNLTCVYLPYGWVLGGYPWSSYRWDWITMWPVLPGLFAAMMIHPVDDRLERFVMGVAALLFLAFFTALGSLGRQSLVGAAAAALMGSAFFAWIAYAIYLS